MSKKYLYPAICLLLAAITSCNNEPRFSVEGNITGAEGKKLYLELTGIEGIDVLDSVELDKKGNFLFSHKEPDAPEFYRLRVDNKIINFAIDSTENININAGYGDFSTGYSISGSENNLIIKDLTIKQIELQRKVDNVMKATRQNQILATAFEDSLMVLINAYKDTVKLNYIFKSPNTTYAYFALFQRINGYLIFDPLNDKEDVKCFGAVATSLNNSYPHSDRSRNLYNIAIKGMKNTRIRQQNKVDIPQEKIGEAGIIDFELKDLKGNPHKLSNLKGKVVILDFIVYQSAVSSSHNIALNELYKKYAPQGLEIYQVAFDADEHFWKTTADKLPWICVRDPEGIYSPLMRTYNIQKNPSYFLINKNNELSKRDENIKNLEENIKKLL